MTHYSHCPDCSLPLGKDKTKCRCGWLLPQAAQAQADPSHVPCAADTACRKPGRMWVDGMGSRERICIEHYYAAIDAARRRAA